MAQNKSNEPFVMVKENWFGLIDGANLSYGELILLCKIDSLSIQDGKCTAGNDWFAGLMHTSVRNVQKYLSKLKDKELVKTFEQREGMKTTTRYIYIQRDKIKSILGEEQSFRSSDENTPEHTNDCSCEDMNDHSCGTEKSDEHMNKKVEHMNDWVGAHEQLGKSTRTIVHPIREEKRREEKKREGADAASEVPSDTLSSSASNEASSTPSFSSSFSKQAKVTPKKEKQRKMTFEEIIASIAEESDPYEEMSILTASRKQQEEDVMTEESVWEGVEQGHKIDCVELENLLGWYEEMGMVDKFESAVRERCDLVYVDLDNFLRERGIALMSDAADDDEYWEI